MKALLICVGSRGDAEPFCSLADKLLERGHSVEFFIQPELEELVPRHSSINTSSSDDDNDNDNDNKNKPTLNIHKLPFTQYRFYDFVGAPTNKGADHPNPRVKFVGVVADIIANLVLPCTQNVLNVVVQQNCNVIVTSALARSLAFAISEKVGIPTCLVHLQPLIPTTLFPHSSYHSDVDKFVACLITKPKEGKPKRPRSAYNFFFQEEREKILKFLLLAENPSKEEVKNDHPDSKDYLNEETIARLIKKEGAGKKISFEEMGNIIGQRWKNIDPNRLATYSEMALKDTERYKNEMQTYNRRQEAKMKDKENGKEEEEDDDENTLRGDPKNLDTYWELERYQYEFLEPNVNQLYEELGIEQKLDFTKTKIILSGCNPKVWLANCFYDDLIPNVIGHTPIISGNDDDDNDNDDDDSLSAPLVVPNILNIGALADAYIPKDFSIETTVEGGEEEGDDDKESDLEIFLREKRPICVGFGSMPFAQTKTLLGVIKELDEYAVFVGKALELPNDNNDGNDDDNNIIDWAKEHIRQVSSLPYAWLLPKCRIMLSHGGAGVVHATLRAGIPPVIAPLMGDQFFFAKLIQAKGLGIQVGAMLPTITKEEWKNAIQAALAKDVLETAKQFGETIRNKEQQQLLGVERLVDALQNKIVQY